MWPSHVMAPFDSRTATDIIAQILWIGILLDGVSSYLPAGSGVRKYT